MAAMLLATTLAPSGAFASNKQKYYDDFWNGIGAAHRIGEGTANAAKTGEGVGKATGGLSKMKVPCGAFKWC